MNKLLTGIIAASVATVALADVTVNFRNNVLPNLSTRLVTYGATFGAPLTGTPVVNGVPAGVSYVAQLGTVSAGVFTPVGNTANFRSVPQSDGLAGTWSGANRTVVGPATDATIDLAVRVWDNAFASFDAAAAAGAATGQSATFSYKNALSSPPATTDTYMANFAGFEINIIPEPSTYALAALGLGGLLFLRRKN